MKNKEKMKKAFAKAGNMATDKVKEQIGLARRAAIYGFIGGLSLGLSVALLIWIF